MFFQFSFFMVQTNSGASQVVLVVRNTACQRRRHKRCRFNPWIRTIPWRSAWQPTPVFLPEESPWTEEPDGLQSCQLGHEELDMKEMQVQSLGGEDPLEEGMEAHSNILA